ncbi:MAG: flagellar biosynthetic protein FliR [Halothiobacillus sp. 20-54-6]|nr:MAG: flagellar biosynthetic protein FliR [Halothiobacillus sp. 20-54-6]
MTLSLAEIMGWVGTYLWVLIRVAAVLMVAPVFGARGVPKRWRALAAMAFSLVIAPTLPAPPAIDPLSALGILLVAQQIVIGATMGFVLGMIISAFMMAGEAMSLGMGLGFAQTVDPQNGVSVPLVSQFLTIVVTLLFIALDGPALTVKMLADSFLWLPIAPVGLTAADFWRVVGFGQAMFVNAVLIALPVIISLLMVNIAMGVITRAAPQLNIFSIGFPATLLIGFFLILVSSPVWLPNLEHFLQQTLQFLSDLLRHTHG